MRRTRRPSFGGDASATISGGVDQKRRTELLAEARRKRVAWVEEARGVDEGLNGARRRKETEAAENGKKAESELERLFPSAVAFHDFLSGLAGDPEESPGGDLSAILQPFMVQDVDIGDDRPIPSYNREGVTRYDVFLDKLRHPRAAEVVKTLQQFVAAFKARAERPPPPLQPLQLLQSPGPRDIQRSSTSRAGISFPDDTPYVGGQSPGGVGRERRTTGDSDGGVAGVTAATMSGMIHAFLGRVENQMRESALWRRETQTQWDETRESLERIVMHKVFDQAYDLCSDPPRDEAISNRLRSLGFLTEEHLGVPPLVDREGADGTWSDAKVELLKMSDMRCPGDMLRCIIRCTRIVGSLLTGSQEGSVLPGADEFLPALILLVKRANPPNIHSNLEFVQSFRDPSKLMSEAGYVLTQLVSAVCFLEDVDASLLTIAHGEFERGLKGFQESAREGLQAHQQKVKKEEEQERILHNSSHSQYVRGGETAESSSSSSTAAAPGAATAAVATPRAPGAASPASLLAGPAPLPKPGKTREIAPGEVRAKRQAFRVVEGGQPHPQSQHLLLASASSGGGVGGKGGGNLKGGNGDEAAGAAGGGRSGGRDDGRGQQHRRPRSRRGQADGDDGRGLTARLRFVGCTPEELRVSELPALLAEHQQLARLCEELLAERAELGLRRRRL